MLRDLSSINHNSLSLPLPVGLETPTLVLRGLCSTDWYKAGKTTSINSDVTGKCLKYVRRGQHLIHNEV